MGLVSEELLNALAPNIGRSYRKLGKALGLKETKIQNIEDDHRYQEDRGFQIMYAWWQSSSQPRRYILAQALVGAGLASVVREM